MDEAEASLLDTVFGLLESGASDPASPFHVLTLGTVAGAAGAPETAVPRLRSVIVRGFERRRHRLTVHTDARSPKVAEIKAAPQVELHVWNAAGKVQLRLTGLARLCCQDERTEAEWSTLGEHSRATYQVGASPSSVLQGLPPADQDLSAAKSVFMVIDVTLSSIEHLLLSRGGNRRALFRLPAAGDAADTIEAEWLVA